jgi:hypothetical protein
METIDKLSRNEILYYLYSKTEMLKDGKLEIDQKEVVDQINDIINSHGVYNPISIPHYIKCIICATVIVANKYFKLHSNEKDDVSNVLNNISKLINPDTKYTYIAGLTTNKTLKNFVRINMTSLYEKYFCRNVSEHKNAYDICLYFDINNILLNNKLIFRIRHTPLDFIVSFNNLLNIMRSSQIIFLTNGEYDKIKLIPYDSSKQNKDNTTRIKINTMNCKFLKELSKLM